MMENDAGHRDTGETSKPTLYVVATPIGNLRDITLRAIDVLKSVTLVAAEDTRVTAKLLNHFGIEAKLVAVHEHNESRVVPKILAHLAQGGSVAVVSDAGTPTVSDPGAVIVAAARAAGYHVSPVPGASAAMAALSASGFAAPRFLFYGFLPPRAAARRRALAEVAPLPFALVFFEAPHRIAECAADLSSVLGPERRVLVARELTKIFEEIHGCTLSELESWLEADPNRQRGEFVILVEGAAEASSSGVATDSRELLEVLLDELPVKQAVSLAARISGARRNELYALALELKAAE